MDAQRTHREPQKARNWLRRWALMAGRCARVHPNRVREALEPRGQKGRKDHAVGMSRIGRQTLRWSSQDPAR